MNIVTVCTVCECDHGFEISSCSFFFHISSCGDFISIARILISDLFNIFLLENDILEYPTHL